MNIYEDKIEKLIEKNRNQSLIIGVHFLLWAFASITFIILFPNIITMFCFGLLSINCIIISILFFLGKI